jgi:hypothetical protein
MTEEHVNASQTAEGGGAADDASRIVQLEEKLAALLEGQQKRDQALAKMQSDRDKAQQRLEKEQKRRERLEAQQRRQVDKIPATEQTEYLRNYAAAADQKATRFELAHQYGLDPMELDRDYPNAEAMRLHAIELNAAKGSHDVQARLDKLTTVIEQIVSVQQKEAEQAAAEAELVTPDTGGPRGVKLPARDALDEFTALAEEYRNDRDFKLATQAVLARIHRDPSKIMGPARPSEEIPPGLREKMNRR